MMDWYSKPIQLSVENRCRAAWTIFFVTLVGWPATHVLMLLTKPAENTWVFHVLLAISWLALTITAVDILVSTHASVSAEASADQGKAEARVEVDGKTVAEE